MTDASIERKRAPRLWRLVALGTMAFALFEVVEESRTSAKVFFGLMSASLAAGLLEDWLGTLGRFRFSRALFLGAIWATGAVVLADDGFGFRDALSIVLMVVAVRIFWPLMPSDSRGRTVAN